MSYDENSFLQGIAAGMAIAKKFSLTSPYLTFKAPGGFSISVKNSTKNWDGTMEYSQDGSTWTTWDGTTAIASGAGGQLFLRGTGNTKVAGIGQKGWVFTGSDISVIGSIESILDWESASAGIHPTMANYCFAGLFMDAVNLVSAPALPSTVLSQHCYNSLFWGCTGLVKAPALPAEVLEYACYGWMFYGCTSLTAPPLLPSTSLAQSCYYSMFQGCTSLTMPPALPAKFLPMDCYHSMFQDCESLAGLPKIQTGNFPIACCQDMFNGCSAIKLSTVKTGDYLREYRLPAAGTAHEASSSRAFVGMFTGTGGTFTGTPSANTVYYTENQIVSGNIMKLPDEYQEIEYIDFTPPAGFPVTIPTSFKVEAKFAADELALNRCVFGYRASSSSNEAFIVGTNANGGAFLWVSGSGTNGIDDNLRVPYSIGVPAVVRGFVYNRMTTAFIGRFSSASSYYYGFDGKIYYVKGWDIDNNLSFKFVPCYRKADNVPGFYDVVSDVFYSTLDSTGGGSIALGPDVNENL